MFHRGSECFIEGVKISKRNPHLGDYFLVVHISSHTSVCCLEFLEIVLRI